MIGLALVATVLTTAQRQERITTETARTVDEARLALSMIADEVREARSILDQSPDAALWFDRDHDGLQDAGEVEVYGFRPDGGMQMLVRQIDARTEIVLRGIQSGSLSVTLERTGLQLATTVTLPADAAGRGGITLTTKAVNRGNG